MNTLHSIGTLALLSLASTSISSGQGLGPPSAPPENPITQAKTFLGQALFWDEQLSTLDTVACATCHLPEAAGADPRTLADLAGSTYVGVDRIFGTADDTHSSPSISSHRPAHSYIFRQLTGMGPQLTFRHTPQVFDAAYAPELLLDGRAPGAFVDPMSGLTISSSGAALESQALLPLTDEKEMAFFERPVAEILDDVRDSQPLYLAGNIPATLSSWIAGRDYELLFADAFGSPGITTTRVAQALATYMRTLVTYDQLPFDDFLNGDQNALTAEERAGYGVFVSKGCATCHPGAILTDHLYRNIGLDDLGDDPGRRRVSLVAADQGKFRSPSLRNLALTAPYFHDGSAITIADVIEFFDVGGHFNVPNKDPLIQPLGMSAQEKSDLAAFLGNPLTDPRAANFEGPYERLTLYAESTEAPTLFGTATPGTNGTSPKLTLLEPTRLGHTITVAVEAAASGAPAALVVSTSSMPLGIPFQGVQLYVPLNSASSTHRVLLSTQGLGPGSESVRLTLPADPIFDGTSLYAQWLIYDPSPQGRLAASEAVEMHLFN
ncbi:MAG: cytochrome c peroxidase [Planctomycetota bacterium]|jgi:cytochrome c peroxidase